jgi:hypothetical protein
MAGTFCLGAAVCLFLRWSTAAFVFEAILVGALTAQIRGKFCLGSYIFHWLRRDGRFANQTLPWSRAEPGPLGSLETRAAK